MIIEDWARHIVQTDFDALDENTIEQAKYRIIDIIGCAIGGANTPGCSIVRDLIQEWGGKEEATILVHGIKAPAHNAAWLNCVMARSFDYGVLIPFIGDRQVVNHISETTVPTAVTVAEWKHAGGKELITALVLGDDITTRLTAGSNYTAAVSWDSVGTTNRFGTTTIAGKLLGLSVKKVVNAFGIVVNQLAGSFQVMQDGVHAFKLTQGLSARDGIIAAELADKGFLGIKDPLLSKYGYFALYCKDYDTDILTRDLGKKFYADMTFKPYPGCRFTHPITDCALDLVRSYDIKAEDIERVSINVAPSHLDSPLNQPFKIGEFPQGDALFSPRYAVSSALVRKNVKPEYFTEEYIRDPKVLDLTAKVNMIGTMPSFMLEAAEVTVTMKDGRELTKSVDTAKAHPLKKPLTQNEIEDKFWGNVTFSRTVSQKNAETALTMLKNLEEVDDINKVIRLLVS
jgi:2-methylcitrate dehydratase PrpD